jgi:hypothetical protein
MLLYTNLDGARPFPPTYHNSHSTGSAPVASPGSYVPPAGAANSLRVASGDPGSRRHTVAYQVLLSTVAPRSGEYRRLEKKVSARFRILFLHIPVLYHPNRTRQRMFPIARATIAVVAVSLGMLVTDVFVILVAGK